MTFCRDLQSIRKNNVLDGPTSINTTLNDLMYNLKSSSKILKENYFKLCKHLQYGLAILHRRKTFHEKTYKTYSSKIDAILLK